MDIFDLTGKVAIVTGGNGGLGLGIARGLAKAGAKVAISGRSQEKLDTASAQLREEGFDVLPVRADVSLEDDVNRMVQETVDRFGRVDILVNNAAISWGVKVEEMSLELWNQFIAVDLTSCFLCCKAVYPEMKKVGGGKIINISSIITQIGHPKLVHYSAAKGGMDHMTQSLARAWGPDNIQVNVVLPGLVDTEMMPCTGPNANLRAVKYCSEKSAVKRFGVPEDFWGISVLLASPASDFITGAIIVADGGLSLAI